MTITFTPIRIWINSSAPPQRRSLILSIYAITLGVKFAIDLTLLARIGSQDVCLFVLAVPFWNCCYTNSHRFKIKPQI